MVFLLTSAIMVYLVTHTRQSVQEHESFFFFLLLQYIMTRRYDLVEMMYRRDSVNDRHHVLFDHIKYFRMVPEYAGDFGEYEE